MKEERARAGEPENTEPTFDEILKQERMPQNLEGYVDPIKMWVKYDGESKVPGASTYGSPYCSTSHNIAQIALNNCREDNVIIIIFLARPKQLTRRFTSNPGSASLKLFRFHWAKPRN